MGDISITGIPEEMYQIKLLAAIGLSKMKSEELNLEVINPRKEVDRQKLMEMLR